VGGLANYNKEDLIIESGLNYNDFLEGKYDSIPFGNLSALIMFCRLKYDYDAFFYNIGNKAMHFHYEFVGYLTSFATTNTEKAYLEFLNSLNELNFCKIEMSQKNEDLIFSMQLHEYCEMEYKNMQQPLIAIMQGFWERIFYLLFGEEKGVLLNRTPNKIKLSFPLFQDYKNSLAPYIDLKQVFKNDLSLFLNHKFSKSITDEINFYLGRDICFTIEEIADKMNLSVRSLQRKLKDQKLTFSGLKEELRKKMVVTYFKDENLSISDISFKMGYSERSAFERAFKKWFDSNPKAFRTRIFDLDDDA